MKELSIEEKAKAYDKIIEKANKMHSENCEACQACIEELIPELAESEDERIRKLLVEAVTQVLQDQYCSNRGISKEKVVTWIEKKKSTVDINDVCEWLQKYAKCYVNGEYNHYHNCVEYDGTIDVDSMIERLKCNFG